MSHNRKKAYKTAVSALVLGAFLLPLSANAAVHSPQGRAVTYKTSLAKVEGLDMRVLDWRNPSLEFVFDASDTDWTDGVELLLSADPLGKVSRRTPLMVQFNNGKPTPVITKGRGFDARIQFDPALIRPRNNVVRFTYNTPAGAACLTPQHGGWALDFKNSLIIVKGRGKARNFDIREVNTRLRNPMTAPKSVRILARGQNTSALQALAAQGVGLRMEDIPEFKTVSGTSEFDIILGRRDQLSGWVSDADILTGEGPRIAVHDGRPMRLVITGDTDEEVLETAKSFATYNLPDAHRPLTSLGEMATQTQLSSQTNRIDNSAKISELTGQFFEESWGPKPKQISFDVADPIASSGELMLRISSGKAVSDDSRVSVDLNGKSLGYAKLNKSRKSVAFDIPEGALQGTDNVLSITPDLSMREVSGCNFVSELPEFYLGGGSKLTITSEAASPVAELSTLTASGGPFSIDQGRDTVVMLPAASGRDYNASLKLMAKLARSSGHGWTKANYLRSANSNAIGTDKNILVIGPSSRLGGTIRTGAPKGLSSALKGLSLSGADRIASIDRFAANDEATTLELYAARQAGARKIRSGGVAALYPSPFAEGKVMGVITNVPGRSFAGVAKQLIAPEAWNAMEGSVARWDGSKVIMAQMAMDVPGFAAQDANVTKLAFLDGIKAKATNLSWPEFKTPKLDGFDASGAKAGFENLKRRAAALMAGKDTSAAITPRIKPTPEISSVPALRGFSKVPATSKTAIWKTKFKTWSNNAKTNTQQFWDNLKRDKAAAPSQSSTQTLSTTTSSKLTTLFPEGSKAAMWSEKAMTTPAIKIMLAIAFALLLLAFVKPDKRRED